MPWWAWLILALAVVAAVVAAWFAYVKRRRRRLRARFGPEYDAAVERHGSRWEAEADLERRLKRREQLEIRPLDPQARQRYEERWRVVQAEFVDAPDGAVANAHALVRAVMQERGYPTEDFDQRVADVSVDHPTVAENYRAAAAIAERSARGDATTEELRQALQHYRALFDDLLSGVDSGSRRDAASAREQSDREGTRNG
jgi:hypothetical protein